MGSELAIAGVPPVRKYRSYVELGVWLRSFLIRGWVLDRGGSAENADALGF